MTRRQAREQALCMVFEGLFSDEPLPEIMELANEAREFKPDPFAKELASGVFENLKSIDEKIEKYSIAWSKGRMSKVTLAILRLAICEIDGFENIPVSVTINEAVELAKRYGADGDSAFVNGILGAYVRAEKTDAK